MSVPSLIKKQRGNERIVEIVPLCTNSQDLCGKYLVCSLKTVRDLAYAETNEEQSIWQTICVVYLQTIEKCMVLQQYPCIKKRS